MSSVHGRIETVSLAGPLPKPATEEVLLFEFDLDGQALSPFESILHPQELEASRRRSSAELRGRYVTARGTLRTVLGSFLYRPAESLDFLSGAQGKPFLDGGPAFNLAHSEGIAVLAISSVRGMDSTSLGVDVEHVRDWPDLDELAQTVFTPSERAWRDAHATDEERRGAFFQLWTAKESYMKATGEGLTCPLQEFQISGLETGGLGRVCSAPSGRDLGYRVIYLPQVPGRCASLCLRETWKELPIRRFRLQ